MPALPASIVPILLPFAPLFTAPTWRHVQVLLLGTLLAQGPRTVAAALRVMGLAYEPRFEKYHRVLSRGRWSGLRGAQILLGLLVPCLPTDGPLVIAADESHTYHKMSPSRSAPGGGAVRITNNVETLVMTRNILRGGQGVAAHMKVHSLEKLICVCDAGASPLEYLDFIFGSVLNLCIGQPF
jgi:hypothetical protein